MPYALAITSVFIMF